MAYKLKIIFVLCMVHIFRKNCKLRNFAKYSFLKNSILNSNIILSYSKHVKDKYRISSVLLKVHMITFLETSGKFQEFRGQFEKKLTTSTSFFWKLRIFILDTHKMYERQC